MSSSDLVEVRYANSLKRPRTDSSSSSVVAMPVRTYRKKANARGLYKKRKIYRRLSLRTQLNKAQNAVHHMVMSGNADFAINGINGFTILPSQSPAMQFTFTLQGVFASLGSAAPASIFNFSNAPSYRVIFDQYRLDKVVMQVLFSSNTSQVNNAVQFPIVYAVTDTNDALPLSSIDMAISYGNTKIMQLGTASTNGQQFLYLPNPTVEEDALTTSGTVVTGAGRRSPWLNTENQTIVHNAVKLFVNTPSGTNVTSGIMTVIFRCFFSFKNII